MNTKPLFFALTTLALSIGTAQAAARAPTPEQIQAVEAQGLPVPFEEVFGQAMNDPNVILYLGDLAYREGDHDKALRWMLEAAKYEHPGAIRNAKHMIEQNQGTYSNREAVIDFLSYYAEAQGDRPADVFARMYLADYYRGERCVWFGGELTTDCDTGGAEAQAGMDLRQSYYFYEGAARQGEPRARYMVGMMTLLGQGAPRNVPLAVEWLTPLAEAGNSHVAYIIGEIHQRGYWLPQDQPEASRWFAMASANQHIGAALRLAQNFERGIQADLDEPARMAKAVELYTQVLSSILTTDLDRAEAAYRLGLLLDSYAPLRDESRARQYMMEAVGTAERTSNEFAVKALVWLGDRQADGSLAAAVKSYHQAERVLEQLPLAMQQRHAVVWQKIAYAYARGDGEALVRDERRFSHFMSRHHEVLAQRVIVEPEAQEFAGYHAFVMPR